MSFAYGTPIAGPHGFQPIERYEKGDQALGGSIAAGKPSWTPKAVAFSEGAPPGPSGTAMIFVRYGKDGSLIVTADQSFLLADGTLKLAGSLVPDDRLAGADGGAVAIVEVAAGQWQGGVHAIALDPPSWNGNPDGHLLDAAGIVVGDFLVDSHREEWARKRGATRPQPRPGPLAYD